MTSHCSLHTSDSIELQTKIDWGIGNIDNMSEVEELEAVRKTGSVRRGGLDSGHTSSHLDRLKNHMFLITKNFNNLTDALIYHLPDKDSCEYIRSRSDIYGYAPPQPVDDRYKMQAERILEELEGTSRLLETMENTQVGETCDKEWLSQNLMRRISDLHDGEGAVPMPSKATSKSTKRSFSEVARFIQTNYTHDVELAQVSRIRSSQVLSSVSHDKRLSDVPSIDVASITDTNYVSSTIVTYNETPETAASKIDVQVITSKMDRTASKTNRAGSTILMPTGKQRGTLGPESAKPRSPSIITEGILSPRPKAKVSQFLFRSPKPKGEDQMRRSTTEEIISAFVHREIFKIDDTFPEGSLPQLQELNHELDCVDYWNFNVFNVDTFSNHRPLTTVCYTIFKKRNLFKPFAISPESFIKYMMLLEDHYHTDITYHTSVHAADVVQTMHYLLSASIIERSFTDLEIFAALFSSAVHDVDHPGVTNKYLMDSKSHIALMYSDKSVLESYHLYIAFSLLADSKSNIMDGMSRLQYKRFRANVIDIVLATDMSYHVEVLARLSQIPKRHKCISNLDLVTTVDRKAALEGMIHCADLANPAKPLHLYKNWVAKIMNEFFSQGDIEREKGVPISPMCDRNTADIPKTQVGFIDYVVYPMWDVWADVVFPDAEHIIDILHDNREYYNQDAAHGCKPRRNKQLSNYAATLEKSDDTEDEIFPSEQIRVRFPTR